MPLRSFCRAVWVSLLALAAGVAGAAPSAGSEGGRGSGPEGALLHVRSTRSDGAVSHGSGVALGGDLVLTARHVLACGVFDSVEGEDGQQRPARAIASSPGDDLALLRVPGLGAPPLELGPVPSAAVDVIGVRGRVLDAPLRWADGLSVAVEATRHPGDSGGPMLDRDGRLVALVTDTARGALGEGFTLGTGVEAIARFLDAAPGHPCSSRDRAQSRILRESRAALREGEARRALRMLLALRGARDPALRRAAASRSSRALLARGEVGRATQVLAASLRRDPDDLRRRFELARVRLLSGEPLHEELLALAGHPQGGLLLRIAAEKLAEGGREAEGLLLVERALERRGALPHLLAARCRARLLLGDPRGAAQACEEALAQERPFGALLDAATLALEAGRPLRARALLDEAAQRGDSAQISSLRALAELASGGAPEAALGFARDSLAQEESVAGLYLFGVALALTGELPRATEAARRARLLGPGDARVRALQDALAAGVPVLGLDGGGRLLLGAAPPRAP